MPKHPAPCSQRCYTINKKEKYKAFAAKKEERLKQMSGTLSFPDIDPAIKSQNEQAISRFLKESRRLKSKERER